MSQQVDQALSLYTSKTSVSVSKLQELASGIKLVVFDVDGVLTNGALTYSHDGEQVKHFNVKDGVGVKLLQEFGVAVAVISAKDSAPLTKRMADLSVKHFFPGTKDKWPVLESLLSDLDLTPDQVCYVGDDVIDLKVMKRIALPITPADGFWMVKKHSSVVTEAGGGQGVAREVADLVLASKMNLEEAYIQAMLPQFELIK